MAYARKTVDCWRFYGNYGHGWELECIEFTRGTMLENKRAYEQNSPGALKIVKGRMLKSELSEQDLADIEALKTKEREERHARMLAKRAISPNASDNITPPSVV